MKQSVNKTENSINFNDEGDMQMPILSFDKILEANKDVLKRLKEK